MSAIGEDRTRRVQRGIDAIDRAPRGRELSVEGGSHPDKCRLVRKLAGVTPGNWLVGAFGDKVSSTSAKISAGLLRIAGEHSRQSAQGRSLQGQPLANHAAASMAVSSRAGPRRSITTSIGVFTSSSSTIGALAAQRDIAARSTRCGPAPNRTLLFCTGEEHWKPLIGCEYGESV